MFCPFCRMNWHDVDLTVRSNQPPRVIIGCPGCGRTVLVGTQAALSGGQGAVLTIPISMASGAVIVVLADQVVSSGGGISVIGNTYATQGSEPDPTWRDKAPLL